MCQFRPRAISSRFGHIARDDLPGHRLSVSGIGRTALLSLLVRPLRSRIATDVTTCAVISLITSQRFPALTDRAIAWRPCGPCLLRIILRERIAL